MEILLFENFILNEGRDADLYHWVSEEKIKLIVQSNMMFPKWHHEIDGKVVYGNSMSRNKQLNYFYEVRLTFDQAKLNSNHKIIPIDGEKVYHNNDIGDDSYTKRDRTPNKFGITYPNFRFKNSNQTILAEEFVIGKIVDIHKYIKKIEVFDYPGTSQEEPLSISLLSKLKQYAIKHKIKFETVDRDIIM